MASLALTLVLGELLMRALRMHSPPPLPSPSRPDLYEPHAIVGYVLRPSTHTCTRYPSESNRVLEVVSNSDGFRSSKDLGSPDPRPRILVLGDSFVQGEGVEEGERFHDRIEQLEPGYRTDLLAASGWGVDLMVKALEHFGEEAQPNVVVLSVYTDDFRRAAAHYTGLGYPLPRYGIEDGQLVDRPYAYPSRLERIRLLRGLRSLFAENRNLYPLHEAILDRFVELTTRLGAVPVVLFLPGRDDTPEDQERRGFLGRWADDRGVAMIDLTDALHGAGVESTYFPNNPHWNAAGHDIAALPLLRLLREDLGLAPASEVEHPPPVFPPRERSDRCHDATGETATE